MKIIEKKKDKGKVSVAIEGDMNIYSVKELKDGLSKYFENVKNMEFDLSSVDKIDTAGFQLLVMIKKEIEGRDKTFIITNPTNEITRIFELYGEHL